VGDAVDNLLFHRRNPPLGVVREDRVDCDPSLYVM
jgi:hypothetical protein